MSSQIKDHLSNQLKPIQQRLRASILDFNIPDEDIVNLREELRIYSAQIVELEHKAHNSNPAVFLLSSVALAGVIILGFNSINVDENLLLHSSYDSAQLVTRCGALPDTNVTDIGFINKLAERQKCLDKIKKEFTFFDKLQFTISNLLPK